MPMSPTLESRHGGTTSEIKLSQHMKRILTLSIAIMAVATLSANAADAKATYEKDCAQCHGADAKVQDEMKDEAGFKAIKEGLKDKDGKKLMSPAEGMSDDEIKALVAYMR